MRGLCFVLIILLTALACRSKGAPPAGILESNKMAAVIWDLVRVDEYAATRTTLDSIAQLEVSRARLYQQVFQLHKIDAASFRSSYQYYETRPVVMRTILDTIAVRHARVQNQHGNQQPKPTIQAY